MELIETAKTWLTDNGEWLEVLASLTLIIGMVAGGLVAFRKFFSRRTENNAVTTIVENLISLSKTNANFERDKAD